MTFPGAEEESVSPLEKMARTLDERLRLAGRTVEVKEAGRDSGEVVMTFPGERQARPKPNEHRVQLAVEWGGESHSVVARGQDWLAIQQGCVTQGWYEGEKFEVRWNFNCIEGNSLVFDYGDDGAQGFIGQVNDARVLSF